jgi:hypothetical protein
MPFCRFMVTTVAESCPRFIRIPRPAPLGESREATEGLTRAPRRGLLLS